MFLKDFFEKVDFEKFSRRQKSMQNYPVGKELKLLLIGRPVQERITGSAVNTDKRTGLVLILVMKCAKLLVNYVAQVD